MSSSSNGSSSNALEENLKYLEYHERVVFFTIFLVIFAVALFGNIAAIVVISKSKHRCIQKTCIITLAISDIVMVTSSSINHLETFSHHLMNWTLGEFMCSVIPTCQIFGVIASCIALVAIAVDRYRNVVHALSNRWNPNLTICVLGATTAWVVSAGISYPMWNLYDYRALTVYYLNGTMYYKKEILHFCLAIRKEELMNYHICVIVIVFVPLITIFFWLYYNIAALVWKHRKPLSTLFQKKDAENSSPETSTSQVKSSESMSKNSHSTMEQVQKIAIRNRNIRVERKIRTFKIIVVLMMVFMICRLPYHVFTILKLVNTYNEHEHWIIAYVFNGLVLLNCALNPFLYAFLNATINVCMKIHKILIEDFVCKVCCCCCTNAEFEEFEKENPFIVGNFEQRKVSAPMASLPRRP